MYLSLHDEHPLMQKAIEIITVASIPGEKNPFSLFKELKELSLERTEFSPPSTLFEGSPISINIAQLGEMARGSKIEREALPNVTRKQFDDLLKGLEGKSDDPKMQETLTKLGTTWHGIMEAVGYLRGLLDLQGENVSDAEAQWRAILSSILEKPNVPREGFYFTEQEDELVTALGGIGHCGPKKNEGIQTAYLLLNPKYQYQLKLSKWVSAEEQLEIEDKIAAMDFVRAFIKSQPDPIPEAMAPHFASFINENLREGTGYINRLFPELTQNYDFWDLADDDISLLMNENGALDVLKAFKEEEETIAAEEKAISFVSGIVKHFMDQQFVADNAIIKELTGVEDMPQGVHQLLYLRNLIGHFVGVSRGPVFDPHTQVLYDNLLSFSRDKVSRDKALDVFFKHVTPESLIDEVVSVVNSAPKENKAILAPIMGEFRKEGENAGLTRRDAVALLTRMNFLSAA